MVGGWKSTGSAHWTKTTTITTQRFVATNLKKKMPSAISRQKERKRRAILRTLMYTRKEGGRRRCVFSFSFSSKQLDMCVCVCVWINRKKAHTITRLVLNVWHFPAISLLLLCIWMGQDSIRLVTGDVVIHSTVF